MIFSEIYQTRIEDYDINGFLSLEAVLRIFENIGSHHSDSVSNSVIEGSLDGIAWIFVEWAIEIINLPKYGEPVKVQTWVSGKAPSASVLRNFILNDSRGSKLVKGTAKFALFDLNKRKPTRISTELFELYSPEKIVYWKINLHVLLNLMYMIMRLIWHSADRILISTVMFII